MKQSPRCEEQASRGLASPSAGFCYGLGKTDQGLSRSAEAIHGADLQSQSRDTNGSQIPSDGQQAGGWRGDQNGARCSGAGRRGWLGTRSGRAVTSQEGADSARAKRSSELPSGAYCRFRRGGWAQNKAATILGTVWTFCSSIPRSYELWHNVTLGDGDKCPRNLPHVPCIPVRLDEIIAEAYAGRSEDFFWCAASSCLSSAIDEPSLQLYHSFRWDPNFTPDFVALKSAIDLQYEVAVDLIGRSIESRSHMFSWPVFGSILKKKNTPSKGKRVSFEIDKTIPSFGGDCAPLSLTAVSSYPQKTDFCSPGSENADATSSSKVSNHMGEGPECLLRIR